jgi:uncharacterized protein YbaA (DUF1428 family)
VPSSDPRRGHGNLLRSDRPGGRRPARAFQDGSPLGAGVAQFASPTLRPAPTVRTLDPAPPARKIPPMPYVDGYVIPIPTKNVAAYRRMAAKAGKVWRDHGALEFRECVGDDLQPAIGPDGKPSPTFPRLAGLKKGETVLFSWVVYKSRAHRDRVNAKVMKDPRLARMMNAKKMPFDVKRMAFAGFKTIVDM